MSPSGWPCVATVSFDSFRWRYEWLAESGRWGPSRKRQSILGSLCFKCTSIFALRRSVTDHKHIVIVEELPLLRLPLFITVCRGKLRYEFLYVAYSTFGGWRFWRVLRVTAILLVVNFDITQRAYRVNGFHYFVCLWIHLEADASLAHSWLTSKIASNGLKKQATRCNQRQNER